jgi:DNA invertase Pin-like site-specific DNA recombinase
LAAQLAELRAAKCEKIFQEKISGARSDRKRLTRLMAVLAKGDISAVARLVRLARSTRDLLNLLALQLPFMQVSESMGNHDSKIVDAASVD